MWDDSLQPDEGQLCTQGHSVWISSSVATCLAVPSSQAKQIRGVRDVLGCSLLTAPCCEDVLKMLCPCFDIGCTPCFDFQGEEI